MLGRPAAAIGEGLGELEAQLTEFFADHYERLNRLASLVCHSSASVEDAVQAAMERAWRSRNTLHDAGRMRPWLDQIVVREAIRLNRRPWWAVLTRATDAEANEIPDRTSSIDPIWIAVVAAFRALPEAQRAVVALHLYEGYSLEETASMTGAGLETTRSRLRLARQRLRHEIGEDDR